jgi:hypothetical protein
VFRSECSRLPQPADATELNARSAEGFAHYSLYPEQYVEAAERFLHEQAPAALTCIGVRTVGAALAHVVAAAAARAGVTARVITVRPRGHPFDRRLVLSDRLRDRLTGDPAATFAVVDEGPGLSGSSFAAVADALTDMGIAAGRIVLFPAWQPAPNTLRSERGAAAFERHRTIVTEFRRPEAVEGRDVSAGCWRAVVFGADERRWPAVHPQHERRKYLAERGGAPYVWRFAGLGRYGRAKLARARSLADGGFTPAPRGLAAGFLAEAWITGHPLDAAGPITVRTLDRLGAYLAFVRRTFSTGAPALVDDLAAMLRANAAEMFGDRLARFIDAVSARAASFDEAQVAVDGRMLPHEWIATDTGLLKTDALDHHSDDFLPGSRDIAWDVAGTIVEFGLGREAARHLIARYQAHSADATIGCRLPFYRAAYTAYRLGYATLAAETLAGSSDGARFTRGQTRYRRSLAALAARQGRDARY